MFNKLTFRHRQAKTRCALLAVLKCDSVTIIISLSTSHAVVDDVERILTRRAREHHCVSLPPTKNLAQQHTNVL